jgi:radical SAM superfamily enzyme YgiQ (UPF0313 family)
MLTRGKVVLFYPAYQGPPLSAPLCLLALASPLREAGFSVTVIDAAISPDAEALAVREIADALCFGMSVLTGPMIRSALRVAAMVRKARPDLPIIWGGWHPSLLPEQTLANNLVDIVVRGQGEVTLLEIAERLAAGQSCAGIDGTSTKVGPLQNQGRERAVARLEDLPIPAFDLVDHDSYERSCGTRKLAYATSLGCPYACNYCTDMVFYKRRFNALSAERVIREVTELVARDRIEEVALLDSNFPVDIKRALAIAKGFLDSQLRFRWTFQASTDFLCRMSEDEVRLLGQSGVTHMGFGTESTSAPVLKLMNKRHQRVDEMYETARKAELGGIHVTFNLIFGYPGETEDDRLQTIGTMTDIARQYSNVSFSPNIFTPYPGIPIWPQLRELGVREPQSLEEWADLPLGANILPWLQGHELQRLRTMLAVFLIHNQIRTATKGHARLGQGLRRLLSARLNWRIRSRRYSFPWELWLARSAQKWTMRRSLLTGESLSSELKEVC